jgi:hypothetical protein
MLHALQERSAPALVVPRLSGAKRAFLLMSREMKFHDVNFRGPAISLRFSVVACRPKEVVLTPRRAAEYIPNIANYPFARNE